MTVQPGLTAMPHASIDDPTGFQQWMSAGLKQSYESILRETLPRELVALLEDDKASDAGSV